MWSWQPGVHGALVCCLFLLDSICIILHARRNGSGHGVWVYALHCSRYSERAAGQRRTRPCALHTTASRWEEQTGRLGRRSWLRWVAFTIGFWCHPCSPACGLGWELDIIRTLFNSTMRWGRQLHRSCTSTVLMFVMRLGPSRLSLHDASARRRSKPHRHLSPNSRDMNPDSRISLTASQALPKARITSAALTVLLSIRSSGRNFRGLVCLSYTDQPGVNHEYCIPNLVRRTAGLLTAGLVTCSTWWATGLHWVDGLVERWTGWWVYRLDRAQTRGLFFLGVRYSRGDRNILGVFLGLRMYLTRSPLLVFPGASKPMHRPGLRIRPKVRWVGGLSTRKCIYIYADA